MDIANVPISVLLVIIFVLLCLFMIVRAFKLPADFFDRDRQRAAMRRRLRELESAPQAEAEAAGQVPAAKPEKKPEPSPGTAKKQAPASPAGQPKPGKKNPP